MYTLSLEFAAGKLPHMPLALSVVEVMVASQFWHTLRERAMGPRVRR